MHGFEKKFIDNEEVHEFEIKSIDFVKKIHEFEKDFIDFIKSALI